MEWLITLGIFTAGYLLGWSRKSADFQNKEKANEILEKAKKRIDDIITETRIIVNVEKHGEIFYLYNRDTGDFVAQGRDMESIKDFIYEKYKGKVEVLINKDDGEESGLL